MTSFSSWGPTDDGRVKPDLVAVGQSVLSASSSGTEGYTTLQGTSMASPVVTGSVALLQEYAKNNLGRYLKSATVKALLLNTVTPMGDGEAPDYIFGFGLLNTRAAFRNMVLRNRQGVSLGEYTLDADQDTIKIEIDLDEGSQFKATIAWTDPQGTPVGTAVLDPADLMLVNDLDMRIISPSSVVYEPFVVNPSNNRASSGDNFRDNVEKIVFNVGEAGSHQIVITHKGSLTNGLQDFSLAAYSTQADDAISSLVYNGTDSNLSQASVYTLESGEVSSELPDSSNVVVIPGAFGFRTLTLSDHLHTNNLFIENPTSDSLSNSCKINGSI